MIPTIPVLFAIINELNISVQTFFSELKEDKIFPGYFFIPLENYSRYEKEENVKGFNYFSILERQNGKGSVQISLLEIEPYSNREKVRTDAFEFIYLIKGQVKYSLGKKSIEMKAGDSLFFDGNIPHVPINEYKEIVSMLVVYFFSEGKM